MNRIYRTLWSAAKQSWQAVPETARTAGKKCKSSVSGILASVALSSMLIGAAGAQSPPTVNQLPTGGTVARGVATITQTATAQAAAMTVNQSSERAVLNWDTFNLGSAASINFVQPNAQAVTLNRVNDSNPSQIYGRITANGQVFLTNASGVYFSPTSFVDVGSFTATTHSISDDNFMSGRYLFERNGATGKIVNEGRLTAVLRGYIALLAPEVQNDGVVIARAGTVVMAAGETIALNIDGSGTLAGISTTPSAIAALIENKLAVQAPDGQIILSSLALNKLQAGVIRNSGSLEANSLVSKGGKIVLEGDEISLASTSKIDAKGFTGGGTVLAGGDWQGSGDLRQATRVTMEAGATIDASATDKGNGGKVVLWSDVQIAGGQTRVNGSIKAEAGSNGGNGGQVETSGHVLNVDDSQVSTRAAQGHSGQWLLDPYSISISTGTQTASVTSSGGVFTAGANTSVINVTTLQSALASGNVEVSTTGAGTQAGDIAVNNNLAWSSANTLKLTAAGVISGAGNISMGTGGGLTFNQTGSNTTTFYSGAISGDGSFTKEGIGTSILTGANTYTGVTTISAGTLQFGNGVAATTTMGTGVVVNNATLAFSQATNQSFAPNTISGTGSLSVTGPSAASTATLTLRADNAFSGNTTLNSNGRVLIGGGSTGVAGALTSGPFGTGVVTFAAAGAQIDLAGYSLANALTSAVAASSATISSNTGASELSGAMDLTGSGKGFTLLPAAGSTLTLSGALSTTSGDTATKFIQSGPGNVLGKFSSISNQYAFQVSAGAGTWTLGNATSGTKATFTLTGGTLDLAGYDIGAASNTRVTASLNGGTLLNSAATKSTIWPVDFYVGSSSSVSTPNVGGDIDITKPSFIYGSASVRTVTKTGAGDLHLKGSYISATTDYNINVQAGNVWFDAVGVGSFSGSYSLAAGAKLYANVATSSFPGAITGAGAVVVRANVTLSGVNTYSGGTTVLNNATLTWGQAAVMSGSTITSSPMGTGNLTLGDASGSGSVNIAGYSLLPHNIAVNGAATIAANSASVDQLISGIISDGSNAGQSLTFRPSGFGKNFEVSGNNTYTGATTVDASSGTFIVSNANALGAASSGTTIAGTSVMKLKGGITVSEAITLGNMGSAATFGSLSGDNTLAATLTQSSTTASTISSDAGTLTFAPSSGNAINYGAGSVALNFSITGNVVVNGPLVGGGGTLTKSGTGTLTLSGVNAYTGGTTISAGTLVIGGAGSLGNGTYAGAISNSGTLLYSSSAAQTLSGIISGAGTLTDDGSGTLTLTGQNTYTGPTNISNSNSLLVVGGAGKLNSGAYAGAINNSGAFQYASSAAQTLSGIISGTGSVITSGTGTLNLSGANTYSGGTTLNGGTLALGSSGAIGSTGTISFGGGSLQFSASNTTDYSPRFSTAAGQSYAIDTGTQSITLASDLSSSGGSLTKLGTGTLILSGNNGYTSTTTLSAGTVKAGSATALGTSNVSVASGAALDLNGQVMTSNGSLTLAGTGLSSSGALYNSSATGASYGGVLAFGAATTITAGTGTIALTSTGNITGAFGLTLSGTAGGTMAGNLNTGAGTLTKTGTGTWTLSGASTYSGGSSISTGILKVGSATALGTGAISLTSGAALDLNGQAMTSTGGLTLAGTGVSSSGALMNSSATGASYAGLVTLSAAATLRGDIGAIALTHAGTITGASYALTLDGAAGGSIASIIGTGTGSVTKAGAGTWTLSGANTYSGGSNLSTGILKAGSATALGTGAINETGGAVLDLNGQTMTSTGLLTLNGSGISNSGALINSSATAATYAGSVSLGSNATIKGDAGAIALNNAVAQVSYGLTLDGAVGGSIAGIISSNVGSSTSTLTKQGAGTWTLNGANTYAGATTISAGVLAIGGAGSLGTVGAYSAALTNNGVFQFASSAAQTLSGILSGTGNLIVSGAGTLTLSGANTYSGSTSLNSGTLKLGSAAALGNTSSISFGGGTLSFSSSNTTDYSAIFSSAANQQYIFDTAGQSVTLASNLSSSGGSLTKKGTGTLSLNGANTYSGGTTLNASSGTLKAGSTSAFGSGSITVGSGASLDLNGQTLTTSNALYLNGSGVSALGALTNSSNTGISYAGLVTLSSASFIGGNAGSLDLTNTGTITGAYGLTLIGTANGSVASIIGTGTGTLTKSGAGTWTLSGANTYSGATNISANSGILKAGSAAAFGTGAITVGGSGSALDLNGQTMTNSTGNLTLWGTGVSSGGALINSSATGASYAGLVTLGSSASIVGETGTIALTNTGSITGSGMSLTLGGSAGGSIASIIATGTGSMTKAGTGIWTLSGANTYSGTNTVSAGTLKAGSATAFGTGAITETSGAALDLNGQNMTSTGALTLAGTGTGTGAAISGALMNSSATGASYAGLVTLSAATTFKGDTGKITLSNAGTITGAGFALTLDGAAGGSINSIIGTTTGTVTKTGAGTWTLSGNNTFTGAVAINAGALRAASSTALGAIAGGVTVASGATLELGGPASPSGIAVGAEALTVADGGAVHNVAGYNTYAGAMTLSGNATITVDAGTTLNFTATATPNTLQVAADKRLTLYTNGDLTFAKALTGGNANSSYLKVGSGTLTTGAGTTLTSAIGVYAGLYDPTGVDYSSEYGSTPDYTVAFYNAQSGGTKISLTAGTDFSGTALWTGTALTSSSNAGAYSLSYASGITVSNSRYVLLGSTNAGNWTITPKAVTVTMTAPGNTYTYNGTRTYASIASDLTAFTYTSMGGSDSIASISTSVSVTGVAQAGSFTVTPAISSLGGSTLAGNYSFTMTPLTVAVAKAPLTVSGTSVANKVYDRTTTATLSGGSLVGVWGSDSVTLVESGTFASANVGTGIVVTAADTLGGSAASNYILTQPTGLSADIAAKALTVTGTSVANKTYNGTSTATLSGGSLVGVIGGDTVTLTQAGTFSSPNAAVGVAVTAADTIGGSSAGNYTLTQPSGLTADINKAHLTVTANNATKTYGDTNPALSATVSGFVNGENLATSGVTGAGSAGTTATAITGAGTTTITAGAGTLAANNYDFTNFVNGTLTINKANATVTASSGTVTYTGQAQSVSGFTATGLVNGETASVLSGVSTSGGSGTNAGSYTSSASGTDSNYNLTFVNGALTINKAHLTVTANNATKTYGDTNPALSATVSGFVNGETLATSGVSGVGSASTTATAITGAGTTTITAGAGTLAANNYDFTNFVNGALTINKAHLTVTANNATKTYGDTNPALSATVSGFVNGETLATAGVSGTGSASTTATTTTGAGTATITVGSGTLAANNYDFSNLVNGTLTINKANATVTASSGTATYTGQAQSVSGFTATGLVNGETASVLSGVSTSGGSGTNAGTYASIASGTDSNYNLTFVNGALTINKAPLSVVLSSQTKAYDGSSSATIANGSYALTGFVGGEGATVSQTQGSYNSANVAGASTVSVNLAAGNYVANNGTLLSNYVLPTSVIGTGTITPAHLSVTGTRTYDGLVGFDAAFLTATGVNGETFALTGAGTLASKNVQTNQVLSSTSGLSLSGNGGALTSNYVALSTEDTQVSVTPRPVNLSAPAASKTYDGTTLYQASANDLTTLSSQLVGGDRVTAAEVVYGNKDAGAGKRVILNTVTINDDNGGNNYAVGKVDVFTGVINKAPLIVSVVNDARFIGQNESGGYAGVVYTGLVGGETASVLTTGSITRSNGNVNAAGSYGGVLQASGWQSNNYNISYTAGDYTIAGAHTLLVRVPTVSTTYGAVVTYIPTAEYLDASTNLLMSITPTVVGNAVTVNDGVGGQATFNINAANAMLSSSGKLQAGGYNLEATNIIKSGNNFQNFVMTGGVTVQPKVLNNNLGVQAISKVYDGSASINNVGLGFNQPLAGVVNGDAVSLMGSGSFDDRHVGTGKTVNLSLGLRGADASNYALASPSLSGSLGEITQLASVTYVGASNGSWADFSNWAGGAMPDRNNVAQVVVPTGKTVVYNSDQVGVIGSSLAVDGALRFTSSNSFTLANTVSGTGTLQQRGNGMLTISGSNANFNGKLDLDAYAVTLGNAQALGTGHVASNGGQLSLVPGLTLPSLLVHGPVTIDSVVKTVGDQTYYGALNFLSAGSAQAPNFVSDNGNVNFVGTVSAGQGSKTAQRSLFVSAANGSVLFNDQVGRSVRGLDYNTQFLASGTPDSSPYEMSVMARTIKLYGDVTTFESQTYDGAVRVGNNTLDPLSPQYRHSTPGNGYTRLLVSMDPSITFKGTVDDADPVGKMNGLDVRAISLTQMGNNAAPPTITFERNVGGVSPLASLRLAAGTQNTATGALVTDVKTDDATRRGVNYKGDIVLKGDVTINDAPVWIAEQLLVPTATQTLTWYDGSPDFRLRLPASGSVTLPVNLQRVHFGATNGNGKGNGVNDSGTEAGRQWSMARGSNEGSAQLTAKDTAIKAVNDASFRTVADVQVGSEAAASSSNASSPVHMQAQSVGVRSSGSFVQIHEFAPTVLDAQQTFSLQLPADTFIHSQERESVKISASLHNGDVLPDWLKFSEKDQLFTGTPPKGMKSLTVKVTATDSQGHSATTSIFLTFSDATTGS